MLRRVAVAVVEVVLLDGRDSRNGMHEAPEQHGDLTCETDVVHRSYRLSWQAHPSRVKWVGMGFQVTCDRAHPPHPFPPRGSCPVRGLAWTPNIGSRWAWSRRPCKSGPSRSILGLSLKRDPQQCCFTTEPPGPNSPRNPNLLSPRTDAVEAKLFHEIVHALRRNLIKCVDWGPFPYNFIPPNLHLFCASGRSTRVRTHATVEPTGPLPIGHRCYSPHDPGTIRDMLTPASLERRV